MITTPKDINAHSWDFHRAIHAECFPAGGDAGGDGSEKQGRVVSGSRRVGARRRFVLTKRPQRSPYTPARARPGEVPLKEFIRNEARRLNILPISAYLRWREGKYPGLKIRRVNARVIFVKP